MMTWYFTSDIDRLECFEDIISEDFNSFQISGYFGSNSGAEFHEMSILGVSDITNLKKSPFISKYWKS